MVGFIRFVIAAILLFVFRLITKDKVKPDKKDMVKITLSGLLGITLYFAAENLGVKYTTASNASLIVASFPAITILLLAALWCLPRKTPPVETKLYGEAYY